MREAGAQVSLGVRVRVIVMVRVRVTYVKPVLGTKWLRLGLGSWLGFKGTYVRPVLGTKW